MFLPLPLFVLIFRHRHYQNFMLPFVALIGIYIFNIVGSWRVINDEQLFTNLYYYSLIAIVVAFYLFYFFIFVSGRSLYINWTNLNYSTADMRAIVPLLVLLWGFSFAMFFLYYSRHGMPAVFEVDLFEYTKLYDVRSEKSTNLPEGMHWYSLGFHTIPAFIFCFTYAWKRLVPSPKIKTIFYLNLPLVLFFSSLTMHKTPFAYLVLYVLIINTLISPGSLNMKKLFGYIAVAIGSITLFVRIYRLNREFYEVLMALPDYFFHRIFAVYTEAHAQIVMIFPSLHDFLGGTSFGNPGHILPYEPFNLSQFLGYYVSGGLMNYSSPSFSQGYANFGIAGFVLVLVLMFLQIIVIQIIFQKSPKTPIFLAAYTLVVPLMLGYSNQAIDQVFSIVFMIFILTGLSIYYVLRHMYSTLYRAKRIA